MERTLVRFKRVAEAFDEVARVRPCESSGSEHSPESMTDLSDLVNSFLERGCHFQDLHKNQDSDDETELETLESDPHFSDYEARDTLRSLLFGGDDNDDVKGNIHAEVELACRDIAISSSSPGFKRRLMARLRSQGLDAGLCKSKWEKTTKHPSGSYEYIDVNSDGTRHIVEVNLAGEFQIARAGKHYTSLLEVFPKIFVGKVGELKQVVKLMSSAIKKSMESNDLHVPPWRRHRYMKSRWFGSYKRTINEFSANEGSDPVDNVAGQRSVGFVPLPEIYYYCREDFSSKAGKRVGNLSAALNGTSFVL